MKVILHDDYGNEHDVTETVKEMYGWTKTVAENGSGWLELTEELRLLESGLLLGLETPEDIDKRLGQERVSLEVYERMMLNAQPEGRFYDSHQAYMREQTAFIKALETLKEKQANAFKLTDDVTNFDEVPASAIEVL